MPPRHLSLICACLALAVVIGWIQMDGRREASAGRHTEPQQPGNSGRVVRPATMGGFTTSVETKSRPLARNNGMRVVSRPLQENFTRSILTADEAGVSIPLPGGGTVSGQVTRLEHAGDEPLLVEGTITHPEPGRFHFRRQTLPGKAGPLFGFIRFDENPLAWQVRPTGADGAPELVRTTVDEVICHSYNPAPVAIPAAHPVDDPIPPGESDIIQLQSLPGAEAVVYLDFDGEERNFEYWGYINALPSGASNPQVFDIWQGVCEDFQPFHINLTTMLSVYEAAAPNQRMRVIVTPTDQAYPGAGGTAIIGSFNSEGDVVCWAFQTTGKNAIEIISHEIGHTLGLSHDGRFSPSFEEYYQGHPGWAPIMGVGYGQPLTQWSKGEYPGANNFQDDLLIISNNNNGVAYREDDHGSNQFYASWLDLNENGIAFAEGIIETRDDRDSFRFSTTGGNLLIQVSPVPPVAGGSVPAANLDIKAELLRVTSWSTEIIATSQPGGSLAASFNIPDLAPGDYLIRVSGAGRGNLISGYSDYASLGSYTIAGDVAGGVHADRFIIAENSANETVVGSVPPRADHSNGVIQFEITADHSGGAFAIDPATGAITVADSALLDFEARSSRWDDPATLDFIVTVSDSLEHALEIIRVVVALTDVNEPPAFETVAPVTIPSSVLAGTPVAQLRASDPDRGDFVTYSITAGNGDGLFAIDPGTGEVTVVGPLDYQAAPVHNLAIRATDQADPANAADTPLTINLLAVPEGITAGSIIRTFYADIPGTAVADLTGSPRFPEKPDSQSVLDSFDTGIDGNFQYGSVVSGYVIPPVTGSYTFWISAGDSGQLLLAPDADPGNAVPVAAITSPSAPGEWDKQPGQQSAPVELMAGNAYYIEARHKQGWGSDHVQAAWQGPGMAAKEIIPGLWLAPDMRQFAPWADDTALAVRDGSAAGTAAGGIPFHEPNFGQQIVSYAITGGNGDGNFTIGAADGVIRVAEGAVFTAGEIHQLTVSATDDGDPAATGFAVAHITVRRLDEGLYAWWQLDEASGGVARDSSGNQRDAWLTGSAAWVPRAAADNALQLSGIDAGFSHDDNETPAGTTPFTVAAWVKVSPGHDSEAFIIRQANTSDPQAPGYHQVSVAADGRVRFAVYGNNADSSNEGFQFDLLSSEMIHDGGWHHVACVRDGESGRVFINTVESAAGTGIPRLLESGSTISVGYDISSFSGYLDATVDDVRIYQEALTPDQVVRIASAPKVAFTTPDASGETVIPPGVGLLLEAAASSPLGTAPSVTWSLVDGPGSVTFGPPDAASSSAVFSVNGTYFLRATAANDSDIIHADLLVNAGCTAVTPFGGMLIGPDTAGFHVGTGPASYLISADSTGIPADGTEDGFYLLGQVFAGDFDLRTRVEGTFDDEIGDPVGIAGLIVRAGTTGAPDDASGFIGLRPASESGTWIRRATTAAANVMTDYPANAAPYWCRITRAGDLVEFWHSPDGVTWTSRGTMSFSGEVAAGLCWTSNFLGFPGQAQFSGLSGFATGNTGPAVDAGADFSAETTIGTQFAGSVDDDGLPNPPTAVTTAWSVISAAGPVAIHDPSDPLTAVTFGAAGEYVLRLAADDGAVRTFDEVTVTVSDPLPVLSVAASTPDASETGPVVGVFTITRSVWLVGGLTVNFTLTGLAENALDYDVVPLSVVIPDGVDSAVITITPIADSLVEGPETVILTITAGDYLISGDAAMVTIADSNHAPEFIIMSPLVAAEATQDRAYAETLAGSATDPDAGDTLTFTKESGPAWLVVAGDGALSGTPGESDVGLNQFTIRVTDAGALFADAVLEITVNFANQPPSFAAEVSTPPAAVARIPYSGFTLADFADDPNLPQGDEIVFSKITGPEWLEVSADGTLSGTPETTDIGPNAFDVRVTDLAGEFADTAIEIIVGPTVLHLDVNGETAGSGATGEIGWDNTAIWSAEPDGVTPTHAWVPGAVAVFSAGTDAGPATITLAGNKTLGGLTIEEGTPVLTGGALELSGIDTVFEINAAGTIESPITGTNLGKTGPATLTLANSGHALTGELALLDGTLELTGSLTAAGGLTVAADAILTGAGTVIGGVSVTGTLAPGTGTGTLTTGPLALQDGARIDWRIDSWIGVAGADHDLVAAESLDLAGSLTVELDAASLADFTDSAAQFTLISTTSAITGFESAGFVIETSSLPAATGHWNIIPDGGDLLLTYTPLTPFEQWQLAEFMEIAADPLVAGALMDPDHDGLVNLVEYALGTDPNQPGPDGIVRDIVEIEGESFLRLAIPRNPDATDLTLIVLATSDLSDPASWSELDTVIETDEPELLVVRDTLGGPRRFLRLRISR